MNNLQYGTNTSFCYIIANRWIGLRLDLLCCLFISFVCIFLLVMKGNIDSGLLIVSLQVASEVVFLFSISFRMYAEVQNHMISSQNMISYTNIEQESDLEKPGDAELERRVWPSSGKIEFEEATMTDVTDKSQITNMSFKVQGGMLVGILGKPTSGKCCM